MHLIVQFHHHVAAAGPWAPVHPTIAAFAASCCDYASVLAVDCTGLCLERHSFVCCPSFTATAAAGLIAAVSRLPLVAAAARQASLQSIHADTWVEHALLHYACVNCFQYEEDLPVNTSNSRDVSPTQQHRLQVRQLWSCLLVLPLLLLSLCCCFCRVQPLWIFCRC